MAFTYDLATDTGKLRLEVGDTTEDSGPRPLNANFSDEELTHFLSEEGTVGRAAARCCEVLATEWSRKAGSERLGPRSFARNQAGEYRTAAALLRAQHGYPESAAGQFAGFNTRIFVTDAT